jgi:hypothetical protein
LRKGLGRSIVGELTSMLAELEAGWRPAGPQAARRSGAWVQVIGINDRRGADEFVPCFGLTYLRAWAPEPRIGPTLAYSRLKTERHQVDDWISERRFRANPESVIEQLRGQVRPRIDGPLTPDSAEQILRERVGDWNVRHALIFIAAERQDRPEALRHLSDLEQLTADRLLGDWVGSARAVISMIDRPDELSAHLDEIEKAKLASLKGHPLGP